MTRICLICLKPYIPQGFSSLHESPVCCDCERSLKWEISKRTIAGIKGECLGFYEGELQRLLVQYKERKDIVLSSVFLYKFKVYLKIKYSNYTFVPLPSSDRSKKQRGFSSLEEILLSSGLKIVDCLAKVDSTDQKNLNHLERLTRKNFIKFCSTKDIVGKNIVLFDDVISTGATIKSAYNSLKNVGIKSIRFLSLFFNEK